MLLDVKGRKGRRSLDINFAKCEDCSCGSLSEKRPLSTRNGEHL